MQSAPIFRLIAGGGITPLGPFVRGGLLDGVALAPKVSGGLLDGALLAADAGQQNGVSPSMPERVIPDTRRCTRFRTFPTVSNRMKYRRKCCQNIHCKSSRADRMASRGNARPSIFFETG
jgi:hypothetical protein